MTTIVKKIKTFLCQHSSQNDHLCNVIYNRKEIFILNNCIGSFTIFVDILFNNLVPTICECLNQ